MHLGNPGAHHTIRPNFVRLVVDQLKKILPRFAASELAAARPLVAQLPPLPDLR